MTMLVVLEAVVIALLAVLVFGLLRSHAEILRALHDLGVNLEEGHDDGTFRLRETRRPAAHDDLPGEDVLGGLAVDTARPGVVEARRDVADPAKLGDAHDVAGQTPDGEVAVVGVVGADRPTLLSFLSTGCVTCQDFWAAFADGVGLDLDGRAVRVVAVTKGSATEAPAAVAQLASAAFTTVMSDEAYDAYAVPVSPYFVLVDAHSTEILGEGAASSWPQLASLLNRAVADRGAALGANRTRRELLGGGVSPSVGPATS